MTKSVQTRSVRIVSPKEGSEWDLGQVACANVMWFDLGERPVRGVYPARMDGWDVFPGQAAAIGMKAIELGIARWAMTQEALLEKAPTLIKRARDETRTLMEHGIIPGVDKDPSQKLTNVSRHSAVTLASRHLID